MLLDTYKTEERYWLTTLMGPTGTDGLYAFRGDLTVLHGELNQAAGKRAPPKAMVRQAVLLCDDEKLRFVGGNFATIDELPEFVARFKDELAPECVPIFYVDNIRSDCRVQIGPNRYVLIHFRGGVVWNELMDELYVEKQDLKGMSGEDKVVVLYEAAKGHTFKYPEQTLDEVLASKTEAKREAWGAV